MSSVISRVTCARSWRVRGVLSTARASDTDSPTRSASSRSSPLVFWNRRGPRRVITSWWTRDFSSANGSTTRSFCCWSRDSLIDDCCGSSPRPDWMRLCSDTSGRLAELQAGLPGGGGLVRPSLRVVLALALEELLGHVAQNLRDAGARRRHRHRHATVDRHADLAVAGQLERRLQIERLLDLLAIELGLRHAVVDHEVDALLRVVQEV